MRCNLMRINTGPMVTSSNSFRFLGWDMSGLPVTMPQCGVSSRNIHRPENVDAAEHRERLATTIIPFACTQNDPFSKEHIMSQLTRVLHTAGAFGLLRGYRMRSAACFLVAMIALAGFSTCLAP